MRKIFYRAEGPAAKWTLVVLFHISCLAGLLVGCAKQFPLVVRKEGLRIDSIVPSQGVAGTPVLIYGSGFSTVAAQNLVLFNGLRATVDTNVAFHTLKATAPAGGTTGKIAVTVKGDSVNGPVFSYLRAPVITNVLYNGVFIIEGSNFDPLLSVVTLSGQAIPGFVYSGSGAGPGQQTLALQSLLLNNTMDNPAPVVVTVKNISSNAWPFLFVPQISSFSQDTAHMARPLTVYGKLFGSRTVPGTLRVYFFDANMRKTYMSPDPAILSWTTNTIQASMPDYRSYFGNVAATNYLPIYIEVSVSTYTTYRGLLYSKL